MGTSEVQAAISKGRGIYQRARGLNDYGARISREAGV
jgi:hypothetical protein